MRPHNHTQQNRPGEERPDPPPIPPLIKQQPDRDAAHNLSDPINGVVQRPSLDVKQYGVIVAKLPGVKVIAGKEHGKEEDDERVRSKRGPEGSKLGFP